MILSVVGDKGLLAVSPASAVFTFRQMFAEKEPLEQERLRLEALHLKSRLEAVQTECQREREVRPSGRPLWSTRVSSDRTSLCRRSCFCGSSCGRAARSCSSRSTSAPGWGRPPAACCGAARPKRTRSRSGWWT